MRREVDRREFIRDAGLATVAFILGLTGESKTEARPAEAAQWSANDLAIKMVLPANIKAYQGAEKNQSFKNETAQKGFAPLGLIRGSDGNIRIAGQIIGDTGNWEGPVYLDVDNTFTATWQNAKNIDAPRGEPKLFSHVGSTSEKAVVFVKKTDSNGQEVFRPARVNRIFDGSTNKQKSFSENDGDKVEIQWANENLQMQTETVLEGSLVNEDFKAEIDRAKALGKY